MVVYTQNKRALARTRAKSRERRGMFSKFGAKNKTVSVDAFGVSVKSNIRYGDTKNATFDLYRAGEGRLPVVVHFTDAPAKTERAAYAEMASAIAAKGTAVAVAGASGESGEKNLECFTEMEEYLRVSLAGERMDPNAVFFSGDGTGAWTVLQAARRCIENGERYPVKPRGVLIFSGVTEPMELARMDLRAARSALKYGFGVRKGEGEIPESAVRDLPSDFPPVFFLHSDSDMLSYSQTSALKSGLKRAGVVTSEYRVVYRSLKRDFYLHPACLPEARSAVCAAYRFISKILKNEFDKSEYTEI